MAITGIYGFQNFNDWTDVPANSSFSPFGKLPFRNNKNYYGPDVPSGPGFTFEEFENRVWLRTVPGTWRTSSNLTTNRIRATSVRMVSYNVSFEDVFGEHIHDETINRFTMGFRIRFPYASSVDYRPPQVLSLNSSGGDTVTTNGLTLLAREECPRPDTTRREPTIYVEVEFDFELGIVKRWIDSVRISDKSLSGAWVSRNLTERFIHIGSKFETADQNEGAYRYQYSVNDFYFMVDTSHKNDGLPSKRLGPIEVQAVKPVTVTVPETWDNTSGKEPADLLKETVGSVDVRNKPSLVTDSEGDVAEVKFGEPDYQEGEILYCEFDAYAYRQYGDAVALNTQLVQGSETDEVKQFQIEPERLRTQANAIKPAKLHRTLDGEMWDESKLGQVSLKLWSSKPE